MQNDHREALCLVAQDEADVEVVSALLQDAIIIGGDMHFDPKNAHFLLVANRFCWEREPIADLNNSSGGAVRERVMCGLRIGHVIDVRKHQWPVDWHDAFLNLLALKPVPAARKGAGCVMELNFSGGPSLRLTTKEINIVLGDLDGGRPTNLEPQHDF